MLTMCSIKQQVISTTIKVKSHYSSKDICLGYFSAFMNRHNKVTYRRKSLLRTCLQIPRIRVHGHHSMEQGDRQTRMELSHLSPHVIFKTWPFTYTRKSYHYILKYFQHVLWNSGVK